MSGWVFVDYLRFNTESLLKFTSSTIIIPFELTGVVLASLGVEKPNMTCFCLLESFGDLLFFLIVVGLEFNWVLWSSGFIYVVSGEILSFLLVVVYGSIDLPPT